MKTLLFVFVAVSFFFFSCTQSTEVFEEVDGIVAVEAEHFVSLDSSLVRNWYLMSLNDSAIVLPDLDNNHALNASNGAYIEILPDTRVTHGDTLINGENFTGEPGIMAIVNYKIFFNNPGKYYVWVRAYSTGSEDNGLHVGLNGEWPESGKRMQWCEGKNNWTWASKQRTNEQHCGVPELIYLEIPSKGVHTISFSMREDGFEMDKFILSKEYVEPQGVGVDEKIKMVKIK